MRTVGNGRNRAGISEYMRKALIAVLLVPLLGLTALLAQAKKPPAKLALPAKNGNIVFDHAAHLKREKNDCKVCHPTLFVQDAKAPLGFRPPHKTEEEKMTSCGACHRAGGSAFATTPNCTNGKCHAKASSKKA